MVEENPPKIEKIKFKYKAFLKLNVQNVRISFSISYSIQSLQDISVHALALEMTTVQCQNMKKQVFWDFFFISTDFIFGYMK